VKPSLLHLSTLYEFGGGRNGDGHGLDLDLKMKTVMVEFIWLVWMLIFWEKKRSGFSFFLALFGCENVDTHSTTTWSLSSVLGGAFLGFVGSFWLKFGIASNTLELCNVFRLIGSDFDFFLSFFLFFFLGSLALFSVSTVAPWIGEKKFGVELIPCLPHANFEIFVPDFKIGQISHIGLDF
jgi:hypothetical protein